MKRMLNIRNAMLATILAAAFGVYAEEYTGPAVTRFYPEKENPELGYPVQDFRDVAKGYIYFETGSKISWAKGLVTQNGETLGTCVYKASGAITSNTCTLNQSDSDNAVMGLIAPGHFTITIYGVKWKDSEGVEQTWEDETASIADVTYNRPGESGRVVSETGFENGKMLSYYPAESTEGVKTIVFSKPIVAGDPRVNLEYGYGDQSFLTTVDYTLSQDGLEMTIDFRGKCYNADTLLPPGTVFTDVDGTKLPNPKKISLAVTNLHCTDGTNIVYTMYGTTLNGQVYFNWDYEDITLPNPELEKAEFYSSTSPEVKLLNMTADTDMMDLYVVNATSLASADITMSTPSAKETIPDAEITKNGEIFTVSIPASIREAGNENLEISLEHYALTMDDGAQHVIAPLTFRNVTSEKFNVSEVKAVDAGEEVTLVTSGLKVTLSDPKTLYEFGEDESGALQFICDDNRSVAFEQGKSYSGRIEGVYMGNNLFRVSKSKLSVSATDADVRFGMTVNDLANFNEANACRLVTLVIGEDMDMFDNGDGTLTITDDADNMVVVTTELAEGFKWPQGKIVSITGIAADIFGTDILIIRNSDDVDADLSGIEEIAGDCESTRSIFNLQGMPVRKITAPGLYIVNGKKVMVEK